MNKLLLTSAGFENRNLEKKFLELTGKRPEDIKVVFIPTAAIDPGAIAVLPKCMNDLLNAGIPAANITVYDLYDKMYTEALLQYDAVYVCGGNTEYLIRRVNENGFDRVLREFIEAGGVFVGVSAGSYLITDDLEGNLGYLNCTLSVHAKEGTPPGPVDTSGRPHIRLTNQQAVLAVGGDCMVIC